ncbi:MAG: hypothetical protein HY000_08760 [Planctomycetes bacterium]|nr:hypothetical protein [Planctomycetota bacterium]
MLVETTNIVSADTFRKELDRFIAAAQGDSGPVAITHDAEIVGFFIGREEYETLFGTAVKELLRSRRRGPTVTQQEARARVGEVIRRKS